MRRRAGLKRLGISLVVAGLCAQFIRPALPRGELRGDGHMNELLIVPASVDSLLRRSCYDCHSDNTRWPWYARIAPVSWFISHDVRHGRSNLDFSRWSIDTVREPTQQQRFRWMCRDVRTEVMPPRTYLLLHAHARLTETDKKLLCSWSDEQVSFIQRRTAQETPQPH
jgi:hypothetical protein